MDNTHWPVVRTVTRRQFLAQMGGLAVLPLSRGSELFEPENNTFLQNDNNRPSSQLSVHLFSKHVDWMSYTEMAQLAKVLGFDGIDLTVRANGLIHPKEVASQLSRATKAFRDAGVELKCLSTDIGDTDYAYTHQILSLMRDLEISHYRLKNFHYEIGQSVDKTIRSVSKKFKTLARLNEKYGVIGSYQNHSNYIGPGRKAVPYFGAGLFDLYQVMKELDNPFLGVQFDIDHASIEGAFAWEWYFELLAPYITSLHVKDHTFTKASDGIHVNQVSLGEGIVDFTRFFSKIKETSLQVPITFYYGYDIGDADTGPNIPEMKKGIDYLRQSI